MANDNPLLLAGMIVAVGVTAKWWIDDYRSARCGRLNPRTFPGATSANSSALWVAASGSLLLLVAETTGEKTLGLTAQQSHMTGLFAAYSLAAAFAEELVFRGYLVLESRGRPALLAGIVGASALFALLHPFLWEWKGDALVFHSGAKGWFSTGAIFAGSLWFYTVRFFPLNPTRSLLPCIVAHVAKNLGVFAIKYAQGYATDWI